MNQELSKDKLQTILSQRLETLRINKEKVPLKILKTKYKKGYDDLCNELSEYATEYAGNLILSGIRIHKDYLEEGVKLVNNIIAESGILKQLSADIFKMQDLTAFESHCRQFRKKLLEGLEPFYMKRPGLYVTEENLREPYTPPLLYSDVNGCVMTENGWTPLEIYRQKNNTNTNTQAKPA